MTSLWSPSLVRITVSGESVGELKSVPNLTPSLGWRDGVSFVEELASEDCGDGTQASSCLLAPHPSSFSLPSPPLSVILSVSLRILCTLSDIGSLIWCRILLQGRKTCWKKKEVMALGSKSVSYWSLGNSQWVTFFTNHECRLVRLMNVTERIIVGQNLEAVYFYLCPSSGKTQKGRREKN